MLGFVASTMESAVNRIKSLKNAEKILLEIESLKQEDLFSDQLDLCILANESAHSIGQHEKALKYARRIYSFAPRNRSGYWRQARSHLALNRYTEALGIVDEGLTICGPDLNILFVATDVCRASGDRSKSLEYARLLIQHHPSNLKGYARAAQDLVSLQRLDEAQSQINAGLEIFPNQLNLLIIASNVYRASGDRSKSLEYAQLLIKHHPSSWNGYARAAQDLVSLQRLDEAQSQINAGLEALPNQLNLLFTATDVYRDSSDLSKSLEYSQALIRHHPSNWKGYTKAITNLIILDRAEEARELLLRAKTLCDGTELPQPLSKLDRYFKEDELALEAKRHIYKLRGRLHALFSKTPSCLPSFDILNHSDYILVANNSALTFNEVDCQLVKAMASPLFIYANLGNPSFYDFRHLFWHDGCSELLYGRTQHVATIGGKLIFKPFDPNKFLGCYFIREGVQHWLNSFSSLNNSYSAFLTDDIKNIIRSVYPESFFYDAFRKVVRQRAPTMGWYMISLFDALSTFAILPQGIELGSKVVNKPRVWTAGFTLSPSYIFEADNGELHDHIFERAAIEYRRKRKMTRLIGSENSLAKQLTGKRQLLERDIIS
jgi:tetratricopeptide (TPR) repeat protein